MKTCKFCNAELPEESTVCPSCGKDNAEVTEQTPAAPAEEKTEAPVTAAAPETPAEEKPTEEKNEEKPEKKLSAGKTVLAIAAVVAVVILALAVLLGVKDNAQEEDVVPAVTEEATTETTAETEPPTVPADGNPDDASCKGTYYADDEAVVAARDTVVATAGDHELTLSQLQVFYWMEVRNFLTQYGSYAAYFGLDYTQSLDTQVCPLTEETRTWHQYFLETALYTWSNYCSMAAEADLNGFEITEAQTCPGDGWRGSGRGCPGQRLRIRSRHDPFQPGRRRRAGGLCVLHGAVLQGQRLLQPPGRLHSALRRGDGGLL